MDLTFQPLVALGLGLSALLALVGPVVFALLARRRWSAPWRAWLFGAGTFFVSQVVLRLPWQIALGVWIQKQQVTGAALWAWLAFSAFTAGLFEEVGRFLAFRFFVKGRSVRGAVMFGLGHGGLEAMLLVGLSMVANLVFYWALSHGLSMGLPAEARAAVTAQFATLTPTLALAAGVERLSSMAVHVGLSVLVLRAFTRAEATGPRLRWVLGAIGFHALSNLAAVAAMRAWGAWWAEAVIGLFALAALGWTARDLREEQRAFDAGSRMAGAPPLRFTMTLGPAAFWTTALVLGSVAVSTVVLLSEGLPAFLTLFPWVLVLALTLWAPRSVRVESDRLVVERLGWPAVEVPLAEVAHVGRGPTLDWWGGAALRVFGNGGFFGFTGLFRVRDLGVVRCWATRLGRPTVLVHRATGRPVLLGVDDTEGLLATLRQRLPLHGAEAASAG